MKPTNSYQVHKAQIGDVPQIHQLVNHFADNGQMLARPLSEIYEGIRDFFVVKSEQRVLGCVALHVCWSDLAEVRSLAVNEKMHSKGIGSRLVEFCLEEAVSFNIPTIFCLTYRPEFFERLDFFRVDKNELPRKVWTECYRCSKYPDCDEVALIKHIK